MDLVRGPNLERALRSVAVVTPLLGGPCEEGDEGVVALRQDADDRGPDPTVPQPRWSASLVRMGLSVISS